MKKFSKVCLGGTFDHLHVGHKSLLEKAFEVSEKIIIGLTTDKKANELRTKERLNSYEDRYILLNDFLSKNFKEEYAIVELNDNWGPGIFDEDLEAIVVSEETKSAAFKLNKKRMDKNLNELEIIVIPLILGLDGKKISSTRIRNGEISIEDYQA